MFKPRILFGLLLLSGCGGDSVTPAAPSDKPPPQPPTVQPQKAPANVPQQQGSSSSIPKGAQYTIFCARVEGDVHVERANRLKEELLRHTNMQDWYVIHETGQSLLYYGYYRTIRDPKDPKESQRAQNDRTRIDQMTDKMGNRPFRQALFVDLTAPDPAAPPEWNLVNATGDCTLQVGVYMGSPQRKEAAVEAVRAARAQGVDAYYFHGETQSLVCIGAWPASAYQMVGGEVKARSTSMDEQVMAAPMTRDREYNEQLDKLRQQGRVDVQQKNVTILDPTLRAAMERYPRNSINGMETKRIVNGKEVYDASQLVPIPRDKAVALQGTPAPQGGYDPSYRPAIPRVAPAQPGGSKLKSIGDQSK